MPPLAIAAGVAAVGTISGALIGAHAQSKAASQAAATQNNATAAQLQLGQQSLALQEKQAGASFGVLSPYASRGNVAGDQINALLGLRAAPAMANPYTVSATPAPPAAATAAQPYSGSSTGGEHIYTNPSAMVPAAASGARPMLADYRGDIGGFQDALQGYRVAHPAGTAQTPAAGAGVPTASGAGNARSAMQTFADSAGMQFALKAGADQINNGAAANGWLQSGAALKALQANGQNIALQQYFPMYTGLLGQQQAVGAGAASAIGGVGANFGNTAANINGQMGNAINSGAQNIGNLQLANGQNQANMWGSIGGALGNVASSFVPRPSY